jgi:hypothetical protein
VVGRFVSPVSWDSRGIGGKSSWKRRRDCAMAQK